MTLVQSHTLTEPQRAEIRMLEKLCRRAEPFGHQIFLSNSLNTHPEMDCFFLALEDGVPAGVLTLFAPEEKQAEVTALVRPDLRRRGIFTALLAAAERELDRFGGVDLLLCHEPVCVSGAQVLRTLPVEPEHSEFLLEYDRAQRPPSPPAGLVLDRADRALLPALAAMGAAAFGTPEETFRATVERFFDSPAVTPYAARLEGRLVGQVYRNTEGGEVYLCSVCVEPALQGRGLGRGMLSLALALALEETEGPVRLEVDSKNMAAYRLYTSCGFRETAREDYYLMKGRVRDGRDETRQIPPL